MRFYHSEILGPKQSFTPEGFLVCQDVPISRVGTMFYAKGEIPVTADSAGIIQVNRTEDDLFRAETLASFHGKPVTMHHPYDGAVNPKNNQNHMVGVVLNPRMGTGDQKGQMLADLQVMTADAIRKVRNKELVEVSCGYDAAYTQLEPGHARQTSIIGNHVALVPKGRCGPICAIGDSVMADRKQAPKLISVPANEALMSAFQTQDKERFSALLAECLTADAEVQLPAAAVEPPAAPAPVTINITGQPVQAGANTFDGAALVTAIDGLTVRMANLEGALAAKADKVEAPIAADPVVTADADTVVVPDIQTIVSYAEILVPGIMVPTFDSATPQATVDGLCAFRRKVLTNAMEITETHNVIKNLLANKNIATMTCDALDSTFVGAAELVRAHRTNVGKPSSPMIATSPLSGRLQFGGTPPANGAPSNARFNQIAAEFWAKQ